MKCVVFCCEWPALSGEAIQEAISAAWLGYSPDDDLTFCALPLSGAGMVQSVQDLPGAGPTEELQLADGTTVPWRLLPGVLPQWPNGCAIFDAHPLLTGMSTWKVGAAYRSLCAAVAADLPIVAYVPTAVVSDGGAGFLAALAGEETPPQPGGTPAEQLQRWWQSFLADPRFGVLYDLAEPYLRPGIDALRGEPESAAMQRAERVSIVEALGAAGVDVNPWLGNDFAGCGGGLGLLAAGGAGGVSAMTVVNILVRRASLDGADLALIALPVADWRMLRDSVVTAVADAASALVVPVVVLAGAVDVGRRELSSIGVSAAYGCRDDALAVGGLLAVDVEPTDITTRAAGIARTWAHSGT